MKPTRSLTGITTISFDGDATLWDFETVMHHSLRMVLQELARHLSEQQIKQISVEGMIRTRDAIAREFEETEMNLEKVRFLSFQRTLTSVGIEDDGLARHINNLYMKHRFEDIELFPDVAGALRSLEPIFTLGLLSNGNTNPEHCGLGDFFAFTIYAQDYGIAKPDHRLFEIALEKAGCSASEMLHVGDSLVNDVAGAQNAGIKAVWLNRNQAPNDANIHPDFEVTDLFELVDLCREIGTG
ncbi:MAG: HAD family hydrolase [Anaerolineae bacterium]|nr:HAD family hydrolase [Anaerolineae bacterium]